jgi:hypothetical protein
MQKFRKSDYAKAKQFAEATKTKVLIYFIDNSCNIQEKELREIAKIELNKRKNLEYCKGMNF